MPVAELVQGLRELYPAARLLTGPARVAPYESDALTAFSRRPVIGLNRLNRILRLDADDRVGRDPGPRVRRG